MSNTMRAFCLAVCAAVLSPLLAVNPSLEVVSTGWSGSTVTVTVHNASASVASGRVRITLCLDDQSLDTLTSGDFTVAAGATISITLSAARPVYEIEDNPEPIGISN